MAITKVNPRTVHLGGPITVVESEDFVASAAITPGMLVELHDDGSNLDVRANGSATEYPALSVALELTEFNETITDAYAAGQTVKIGYLAPGSVFYGIIPSGQNISRAELLQSNGDGKLKSATATTADANLGRFMSLDNPGSVAADTRLRVLVIG